MVDTRDLKSRGRKVREGSNPSSGIRHNIAGWSSLEARRAHNPKVIGSNPIPATKFITQGGIAQLARARGSYPRSPRFESRCRHYLISCTSNYKKSPLRSESFTYSLNHQIIININAAITEPTAWTSQNLIVTAVSSSPFNW